MTYKDILNDIKRDELESVYLLFGAEMYLKDKILLELKKKYIDEAFESINLTFIDGKDVTRDEIINACETLPFMSEKKIVVVDEYHAFKKSQKENTNLKNDDLSDYVTTLDSSVCLIFVTREEKIDNRKKLVKSIKKVGKVIELSKFNTEELSNWAQSQFNGYKKTIKRSELNYFLSLLSYLDRNSEKSLYDVENEINKLVNYIGDRDEITRVDIDSIKPNRLENDIFKLIDYISQKHSSLALETFNEMLLSGEAVQLISYMISRQIRLLLVSKLLHEKGYDTKSIGEAIGVNYSFIVQKLVSQSRSFTEDELKVFLTKSVNLDKDIKTGKVDAKLGVEMFLVELSNRIETKKLISFYNKWV